MRQSLKPITIKSVTLHPVALPLKSPFRTSYGQQTHRIAIIVQLQTSDDIIGWGEASLDIFPGYVEETMTTGAHILRDFLLPMLQSKTLAEPTQFPVMVAAVRGNPFAKAGLEAAVWDAFAKTNNIRLVDLLACYIPDHHTPRTAIPVGVAVSIQPTLSDTLELIQTHVTQGYARIKLKIKPGQDVELIRAVREQLPDVPLMVDANSAYTLADADHLAQLDAFNLMMIEQPLAYNDLYEHSLLAKRIKTPICLDESISSLHDWRLAVHIGAGHILNLKAGRVGGLTEAINLYNFASQHHTPLWIGGMLETGIGRAAALALASLPGVNLPGDISASDRYFEQDIVSPPFVLDSACMLSVPNAPGIGVQVDLAAIVAYRL